MRAAPGAEFEAVVPSPTVRADNRVTLVSRSAAKKGTTALARACLQYHFTPQVPKRLARKALRPADAAGRAAHSDHFPPLSSFTLEAFTVEEAFGGWAQVQAQRFASGALFDQIHRR